MNIPLRTAFIVSHKFGYVVYAFSLDSSKSFVSLFLSESQVSLQVWLLFAWPCSRRWPHTPAYMDYTEFDKFQNKTKDMMLGGSHGVGSGRNHRERVIG